MDSAEFRMRRLVPAGVAVAVAISTLAGCGSSAKTVTAPATTAVKPAVTRPSSSSSAASSTSASSSTSTSTTTAPAAYGTVDRTSATAVAEAMLRTTFTNNTTKDSSPQDAVARSEIWYTPPGAAAVQVGLATGPVGDQWIVWTAHQVVTTVAVSVSQDTDAPPDTATAAARQITVTVIPHGANGWTSTPDYYICFVRLVRSGAGPWEVSSLETDPYTPDPAGQASAGQASSVTAPTTGN
jgi:hypothetical protein